MNIYLQICLLISCFSDGQQIKLFNDIPSQEDKSNFDSFPLVSRTVKEIVWCEVEYPIPYKSFDLCLKGVEEIDEVREVEGELYSKVTVTERITKQHVTDYNSGAEG